MEKKEDLESSDNKPSNDIGDAPVDNSNPVRQEIFTRPECPFVYCDSPNEECKKQDWCHYKTK